MIPEWIENALMLLAWAPAVAFPLMYYWTGWRNSPMGRHIMVYTVVVAAILTETTARALFGSYPGRDWVVLVLILGLVVVLWWRVYLLLTVWRRQIVPSRRSE
ncbi:MAG: putative phage holin [Acidimicrobiales bacterium]